MTNEKTPRAKSQDQWKNVGQKTQPPDINKDSHLEISLLLISILKHQPVTVVYGTRTVALRPQGSGPKFS